MPDRIKRMLAFVIDWNILYLPALLISLLLSALASEQALVGLAVAAMVALILITYALIAARDVIFMGRSLGKRIFGLYVVDKKTLEPIPAGRRFVRNLFFCLVNWLEIILLLVTGETLGDRVTSATVLSRRNLEQRREELTMAKQGSESETEETANVPVPPAVEPMMQEIPAPATATRKTIPIKILLPLLLGVAVVGIVAFVGLIQISLHTYRDTAQAQAAYEYVLASNVFATADLDPADLRMNEYSVNYVTENGERAATAEITFTARESLFRKYTFHVICHQENDAWRVCDECSYITASGVGKNA